MKSCSKCGKIKPTDEFHKDRSSRDGLTSACKICRCGQQTRFRLDNPERAREIYSNWRQANVEDARSNYNRWRSRNVEQRREYLRSWYQQNPGKKAEHDNTRRGLEQDAKGRFTADQWEARLEYHGHKCYYCGSVDRIQVEHRIPLSRGGTNWPSNLVPACRTCNSSKGTKTEKEFLDKHQFVV